MGKVQVGILDGFVGKVGTVVGSFWKGKPVMRAYKRQIGNPQTEAQELVRTRFSTIGNLASSFVSAIRIGFKNIARSQKITEGDYFVKVNWPNVTSDTPGSSTVNYAEFVIAKGNLPEAQFGSPVFSEPLEVSCTMSDTTGMIGADAEDLVYMFVYSPEASAGVLGAPQKRSDQSISVSVPAYWNGHRVHAWGFALGNGTDNKGNTSNSRYLGSGTIS